MKIAANSLRLEHSDFRSFHELGFVPELIPWKTMGAKLLSPGQVAYRPISCVG